jgi:hypothetical protein
MEMETTNKIVCQKISNYMKLTKDEFERIKAILAEMGECSITKISKKKQKLSQHNRLTHKPLFYSGFLCPYALP